MLQDLEWWPQYNNNAICLTMKQLQFQCLPLFADAMIDMMIVIHRILTSIISVLSCLLYTATWTEYGTVILNYWSLIRANVPRTRITIKHTLRHSYTILNMLKVKQPMPVAVDVECCFRCVCFVVCVNLWPKNCRKPWRAKSLRLLAAAYTSYGAADKILRRLTAYEAYGGLWRLTAAARGSKNFQMNNDVKTYLLPQVAS